MTCFFCYSDNLKLYFDYGRFLYERQKLFRCLKCGLIQTIPMPTEDFLRDWYQNYDCLGERDPYYGALRGDNYLDTPEGKEIVNHFNLVKKEVCEVFKFRNINLVDIGSGAGIFLSLAKNAGWIPLGIELNQKAAEQSSSRFGLEIVTGTLETANLKDKIFDVVTLWDIFEHVVDPVSFLKKVAMVLDNKGLLFLETPASDSLLDKIIIALAGLGITGPARIFYGLHHLTLWNRNNIVRLLEQNGFRVHKIIFASTNPSRTFQNVNFKDLIMRGGVNLIQLLGRLLDRQNKMVVIAEKTETIF